MAMTSDPFAGPRSGAVITDFRDQLLLITPTGYVDGLTTKWCKPGETKDAVDADLVVLDGKDAPARHDSLRIFQGPLIGSLKGRIGKDPGMVLARLRNVENKKDPENPKGMWVFETPTDEDKQVARDYLTSLTQPKDPFA